MQISLDEIKIKRRVRQRAENIEALMDSIRRYGLLHPITLNSKYVLIAGFRRYEAVKRLGWHTINAIIIEKSDKLRELEIELEENTQRDAVSEQELSLAYDRLEKLRNPSILARIWRTIKNFFLRILDKS